MRRVLWVVAAASVVIGVVAWLRGATEERAIFEVYGTADSTTLELAVASCNASPVVSVEESDTEVRLTATIDRVGPMGSEDDCADSARVELRRPLGERVVIDQSSGERRGVAAPD